MEFVLALLIGITLGLMGSGGSILTVPILVYVAHIEPSEAIHLSLFVVGITALAGFLRYSGQGKIDYKTAALFTFPSLISVFAVRKFLLPALPKVLFTTAGFELTTNSASMLLFGILMMVAARAMIKGGVKRDPSKKTAAGNNYLRLIFTGLGTGFITGLLGAGGGFMIVPALVVLLNVDMKAAIGTSLLIIAANALTGFFSSGNLHQIPWQFLLTFTGISIVGMLLGVAASQKISSEKLKPAFGWFVLLMGAFVLIKEFF